jgi:hypothetical protein
MRNLTNCFYCQSLGKFPTYGKCAFCGTRSNPFYPVIYQEKKKYFCCGCAWWQFPRSETEREAEAKWCQAQKKSLNDN